MRSPTTLETLTNRREFLQMAAASAIVAGSVSSAAENRKEGKALDPHSIPIIDTHQHLWDLSKFRLPWLKNDGVESLRKSYLPADYFQATSGWNVVKTIYMEVNIEEAQQSAEAEYVLDLCRKPESKMAAAVIGGSPQSDGFKAYIEKFASDPHLKGVRTVLHDADRPRGMCLEPTFVENIRSLGKLGLSFDLCMRPAELGDGVKLIEKCPGTRFIIDHCGNMDVQSKDADLMQAWKAGITAAAAHENVACKISGIVVTAKEKEWKPADLAPVVNHCLDSFGDDRVFFGGDWPVCTLKGTFSQWASALVAIVNNRSAEFRKKLFHDNAVKFYKLDA